MDLEKPQENLKALLECLSFINSTFLNRSLDLIDSNSTCEEEHFNPKDRPARPKGKHRNVNSTMHIIHIS